MPTNKLNNTASNLSSKYAQLESLMITQSLKNASLPFWYERQFQISHTPSINNKINKEVKNV